MYKIIGADGKEYGPISTEQLRQWFAEGRVNAQTRVRAEGASEWTVLSSLPEFAAQAAISPAPFAAAPAAVATDAAQQVNGPAIGLMAVAILGFMAQAASILMNVVGTSFMAHRQMPNDAWTAMLSGTLSIVFSAVAILLSGVILYGALKMKKLESYGLAMACSIIAIIPCISPCCLIGLPIGIWALVILMKPEVKDAFH